MIHKLDDIGNVGNKAQAKLKNKISGALYGLAIGDALGMPMEFFDRDSREHITDYENGYDFAFAGKYPSKRKTAGVWTDDTSMALCLAKSLIECGGFDPKDQLDKYCKWVDEGYMCAVEGSRGFDIGKHVIRSLMRYIQTGETISALSEERYCANGSLMRLAPIPMYYYKDLKSVRKYSAEQSKTTHSAVEPIAACEVYGVMIAEAINGKSKDKILASGKLVAQQVKSDKIREVVNVNFINKSRDEIQSTGYVIHSMEAALWAFYTTNNFKDGVLKAVNLGRDADTIGAIYGQLAGAFYGKSEIPKHWLDGLARVELIEQVIQELIDVAK